MTSFRCTNCNKLLGMIEGKAEIKCSKCKMMNIIDGETKIAFTPIEIPEEYQSMFERKKCKNIMQRITE